MMSCTESLGFESSDEISVNGFEDLGTICNLNEPSSSSSYGSSSFCCYNRRKRLSSPVPVKFPPLLTSLSENGRRSFTLNSVRKDGTLEIVGKMIERPEFLHASRKNGRLTLHLVRSVIFEDDDDDNDDDDDEDEETEEITEGETEEERENEENEEEEEEEITGEEREWRLPPGVRRCYGHDLHVWVQQQQRCVTTM